MHHFFHAAPVYRPMVLEIDTTKTGSAADTIILPFTNSTTELGLGYSAKITVDWGDGLKSFLTSDDTSATHQYANPGSYNIKIYSVRNEPRRRVYFNNGGDKEKLIRVIHWGSPLTRSLNNSFYGCINLVSVPSPSPIFCNINGLALSAAFRGCTTLKGSFSSFNIQQISQALNMFNGCDINETGTTINYDALLNSWASQAFPTGIQFHAGSSKYSSAASAARDALIAAGWTITDGGLET